VLAEGAFAEFQRRDLRLPADLSLTAYDDVPWMSLVRPAITTVSQHTFDMGQRCAELLLARLTGDQGADGSPQVVRLRPALRVRGSTARPSRTTNSSPLTP